TFTPWAELEPGSDLMFYEGLHGAAVTGNINVAKYADLKIGVVPVVNLEWIQKIHRDRATRGYSAEAVTATILDSFMSRPNSIVIPGGKLDMAMQLILTPMIVRVMELRRRAL